ncbi:MAG: alpha/beta hydrolase [Thermoplasmata archaeon]|nr:MAG: alpha/beta hydrolase [Thermoplasmata archaeon]
MIYKETFGKPEHGWVVLVHGLGEHSGRYQNLIQMLNKKGMAVSVFDWPGHGKSSGKRGHTSINAGIKIIDEIIDEIDEKPFLFGHSMGGLTAVRYAEIYPNKIKGLVASAPALAIAKNIPSALIPIAKILGIILPSLTINNRLDPNDISRNKKAVKKYINDSLVHDRISNALSRSIFVEMNRAHKEAEQINIPALLLAGTDDRIVPIDGSRNFINELKNNDKTFKEYKGAYHEIFEDLEWGPLFNKTIVDWITNH